MPHKTPEASFHSGLYEVKLFFVSFVSGRASLISSPLLWFSHSQPLVDDDQRDSSEDTGDTIWLSHRVSESGERGRHSDRVGGDHQDHELNSHDWALGCERA